MDRPPNSMKARSESAPTMAKGPCAPITGALRAMLLPTVTAQKAS